MAVSSRAAKGDPVSRQIFDLIAVLSHFEKNFLLSFSSFPTKNVVVGATGSPRRPRREQSLFAARGLVGHAAPTKDLHRFWVDRELLLGNRRPWF